VSAAERRLARERALELLYEAESRDESVAVALARQRLDPDPYARALVEGVDRHRSEIDLLIEGCTEGWPLARMAAVDRNVLRLGVYELAHCPDVPTGVVLSEATDLASEFSTDRSGPFVNGILARLAEELRA
jgi:N utilization substance protein B